MDLNAIGSIASILSLIFTGWVVIEVRSLHLFYKRHLLLPKFITELARHAKNARKALDAKRVEELKGLLQKCDALIERVPRYSDNALSARAKTVRQSIAAMLSDPQHHFLNDSYSVLNEIDATIASAKAFTGEDKWSQRT